MNTKSIAVPYAIWELDKATFQAWLKTKKLGSMSALQDCKRTLARMHAVVAKPISAITEQDLATFERSMLTEGLSPITVGKNMNMARSYWRFAHEEKQS